MITNKKSLYKCYNQQYGTYVTKFMMIFKALYQILKMYKVFNCK